MENINFENLSFLILSKNLVRWISFLLQKQYLFIMEKLENTDKTGNSKLYS